MDGAWSEWSSWTQCSKTCGGGIKARERSCTNPPQKGNGQSCAGEVEETGACSENPCPKRKSQQGGINFLQCNNQFPKCEIVSFCKMLCTFLIFVNSRATCRADACVCLLKV